MSLDVPAEEEERPQEPRGSLDPEVQDVLRRLLVGELELKVDPITGRAVLDGGSPTRKDSP